MSGKKTLSFPISGELLCSPGYPWRTAEVICAASEDVVLEGKPHNLAGLGYSRMALEKTSSILHVQCYHKAVKASLRHSSS